MIETKSFRDGRRSVSIKGPDHGRRQDVLIGPRGEAFFYNGDFPGGVQFWLTSEEAQVVGRALLGEPEPSKLRVGWFDDHGREAESGLVEALETHWTPARASVPGYCVCVPDVSGEATWPSTPQESIRIRRFRTRIVRGNG